MKKIIEIINCNDCVYTDSLFHPKQKTYCRKLTTFKKLTSWNSVLTTDKAALIPKKGIREDCPLQDAKEYVESNFNIDKDD